MPQLDTVAEIDEALQRARRISEDERTEFWHAIVDGLLDRRVALANVEENVRTIRIMRAAETR